MKTWGAARGVKSGENFLYDGSKNWVIKGGQLLRLVIRAAQMVRCFIGLQFH